MLADSAVVEEWPVWLEVNGAAAVTWMCTPDKLEELATGWLHGEGYIETLDDLVNFFFQAEDGIRYPLVTGVQTCALPISRRQNEGRRPGCGNQRLGLKHRRL